MKRSWKTTLGGVGSILSGVALIIKGIADSNMESLAAGIAALTAGFGLVFARDNNVSSEAAGAK